MLVGKTGIFVNEFILSEILLAGITAIRTCTPKIVIIRIHRTK
jgi:hypothetical protein